MPRHKKVRVKLLNTFGLMLLSLIGTRSWGRPEYAARNSYVSCTMCHESPFGGGIRKIQGKLAGARDYWPSELSKQEWFQVDYRGELANSKGPASTRKGLILMNTTPAVHIPVIKNQETSVEKASLIASYGLGMLDQGLRDSYVLFSFDEGAQYKAVNHLVLGRFQPAFGLETDEHRTYTRLATKTTVMDYEAGIAIAGDPDVRLHYDIALTSGLQSGGGSLATDDSPWGVFLNLRWNPFRAPLYFGASYTAAGTQALSYPLEATSLFAVISTDKFSNAKVRGSILAEVITAHGWNNTNLNSGMGTYFIPSADTAWTDALKNSHSLAGSLQFNYDLTDRWIFLYKQEQFIPDVNWSGDTFDKAAVGFKYYINSNMDINARYEKSYSTRPGITEVGTVRGAVDMAFILFHLWI